MRDGRKSVAQITESPTLLSCENRTNVLELHLYKGTRKISPARNGSVQRTFLTENIRLLPVVFGSVKFSEPEQCSVNPNDKACLCRCTAPSVVV